MVNGINISDGLKWIVGIFLAIAMSVGGYSINLNLKNEARVTTLEIEVKQIRGELNDIWTKYNVSTEARQGWITRFAVVEEKIKHLEIEVERLK